MRVDGCKRAREGCLRGDEFCARVGNDSRRSKRFGEWEGNDF